MKKLSVIIVLYNEIEILKKCVTSVIKNQIPNMEIVVVDNGEDKKDQVKKINNKIKYLRTGKNIGFGQAANFAMKRTSSEYVLILTPDTTLFPGTISETIKYGSLNPDVGLVTCALYGEGKRITPSIYHKFPSLYTQIFEYNLPFYYLTQKIKKGYNPILYPTREEKKIISAKHITGAYLLLKRKMIKDVGYFDKRFIFYREETDYCMRILEKGWQIHYIPKGGIYHSGKGALHQKITQGNSYYLKSTYSFFTKYRGKIYSELVWLFVLISSVISVIYLLPIVLIKKILNKPSKSNYILSQWSQIILWHLKNPAVAFK